MNVSDMISAMRILGIGEVYNDKDSQRISLIFLNLAHDELYRETAQFNTNIFIEEDIISIPGNTNIQLNKIPFCISNVFLVGNNYPKNELEGKSFIDFTRYKVSNLVSGCPEIYSIVGKNLNFFPIVSDTTYPFKTLYPPERTELDINMPESAIPYPLSYHGVLVNGALYYLFQDESGFKSQTKENEALRRWTEGKRSLINYLKGYNTQKSTTFENA